MSEGFLVAIANAHGQQKGQIIENYFEQHVEKKRKASTFFVRILAQLNKEIRHVLLANGQKSRSSRGEKKPVFIFDAFHEERTHTQKNGGKRTKKKLSRVQEN